jgi:hypothetical protein
MSPTSPTGIARRLGRLVVAAVICVAMAVRGGETEPSRRPPSPGEGRAALFGLEASGQTFVYVFDRSASMGEPAGRPLAAAKEELLASIDALGEARLFHVIFYNERLMVFTPQGHRGRPIFADDEGRLAVRRFVAAVDAEGGTRHAQAIAAALKLAPDAIFVLTDADESDDLTADELARLSRSLGRTRCLVAQFGGDDGRRSPRLARLAAASGGDYRVVDAALALVREPAVRKAMPGPGP